MSFLGGIQNLVVDALLKITKFFEDMAGIIKIVENIEADGLERKLGGAP